MQINKIGKVFSYEEQPQMQAEVILASGSTTDANNIYTIRVRYPRPIHGEIMTHRVFGRNARSSRAVPVKTMLNEVINAPYVPWHWLKNKSGMQGTEPLTADEQAEAEFLWLTARDYAVNITKQLFDPDGLNIHKQNPNRLLEPFSWIDTLITSTEWDNFFWLRQHGAAEPHLQDLANLMHMAISSSHGSVLPYAYWHLPYITDDDWLAADTDAKPKGMTTEDFLLSVSAARCARISYTPFDGDASYEKELQRAELLMSDERVHASPFEHQAKPDREITNLNGHFVSWENAEYHGNLKGWIQARKLIPNEVYPSN